MNTSNHSSLPTVRMLLGCSAAVLIISMGVRHSFGLFMPYMSAEYGWGRETFAFAMGLQNLMWGIAQPFAGLLGDRFGSHRVVVSGALLYALGLLGMAFSTSPFFLAAMGGVLIGVAHACTTYSIVFGAMGRRISATQRSSAMGLISAAGSFGQFAMMPVTQQAISSFGWLNTLLAFGGLVLLIMPLAKGLFELPAQHAGAHRGQTVGHALREAMADKSFVLLSLGYFVCGFQVVFIGVHLPSYLKDAQMSLHVAPTALALIGLFNVFGSYGVGILGKYYPQRYLLMSIYILRSIAIAAFVVAPVSPLTVYIFSAVIGVLWLSTVPPTNTIIAKLFGVQYLSMLSGVAFCVHQVGSFLGVWLGGYLYDRQGNYDSIWIMIVALGVVAALLNVRIVEREVPRPALAPAQA